MVSSERAPQEEQNGANFLLYSSFQCGAMGAEGDSIKTMDWKLVPPTVCSYVRYLFKADPRACLLTQDRHELLQVS